MLSHFQSYLSFICGAVAFLILGSNIIVVSALRRACWHENLQIESSETCIACVCTLWPETCHSRECGREILRKMLLNYTVSYL